MSNLEKIVRKLQEQEGGVIHKNKGEKDITSTCGIYKAAHTDAQIWSYLDEVAKSVGVLVPSSSWTSEDIQKVNQGLDKETEFSLNCEFYKTYIKVIDLSRIPKDLAWCFFSLYVNSNRLANLSLQQSSNLMLRRYPNIFNKDQSLKELSVDGKIGSGSREVIYRISSIIDFLPTGETYQEVWRSYFLHQAKTEYVKIGTTDVAKTGTDKDIKFLRGWINRCDDLLEEVL